MGARPMDVSGLQRFGGAEGEEQLVAGEQKIQYSRQKIRISGGPADIVGGEARLPQKTLEFGWRGGQKREPLKGNNLGLGCG